MTRRNATPRKTAQARRLRRGASATERRLWRILRGRRLAGFKFRHRSLVYGYIPDFWCPEAKLAIEIDCKEYAAKQNRDAVRDTRFFSHGIHTVHVSSELVWHDSAGAVELIQAALELQRRHADT
jgi:very-short-patch-repair endonuclease